MSGLSASDYPEYVPGMGGAASTKKLGFGLRPVLVMIDVCKAYFDPSSPLDLTTYGLAAHAPSSMQKLLDAAHSNKIPVLWAQTRYTHTRLRDGGLLVKKNPMLEVFHAEDSRGLGQFLGAYGDGEGINLVPDAEMDDIVLYKKCPSAFLGTNFSTQLAALGVDTLVICGACSSGSVRATALDAMQSGFRAMVVAPACADKSQEVHFANLFDLNAKYSDVVSEEDALQHLKVGWP